MNVKRLFGGVAIGVAAALLIPLCFWQDDDKKETVLQSLGYKIKVSKSPEEDKHTSITLSLPGLLNKENREELKTKITETMETADVDPEEMLLDLPEEETEEAAKPEA